MLLEILITTVLYNLMKTKKDRIKRMNRRCRKRGKGKNRKRNGKEKK